LLAGPLAHWLVGYRHCPLLELALDAVIVINWFNGIYNDVSGGGLESKMLMNRSRDLAVL